MPQRTNLPHRRFVPQLCTKTPDKQIRNVESTSFTRKKSTNLNVRDCSDVKFFFHEFVSTSNWKSINCRKFQTQRKSDFMEQNVEEAKNLRTASQACHLKEANIRNPCRKLTERKSSWPGFGSCCSSTPRHPSQSLRSLFCKQKKSTNGKPGLPSQRG